MFLENRRGKITHIKKVGGGMPRFRRPLAKSGPAIKLGKGLEMRKILNGIKVLKRKLRK